MIANPEIARALLLLLFVTVVSASDVGATPQLARQYQRDCSYCHVAPPRLNERGLAFLARGYHFDELQPVPSHRTMPLAIWNTFDVEARHTADLVKAFPSRVELISVGTVPGTALSYFAEWRALSHSIGSNRRLLNRSGRFEDLFLRVPMTTNTLSLTVGQFRALTQLDVSLRLSLSEPLAFSSSLPASDRARSARLTSLRAFSPSGRQPGVRLDYQKTTAARTADGWSGAVTLPLTGELTIPLTSAASFELEGRPKGVFLEAYRRRGLASIGGHAFVSDDRRMGSLVLTHDLARRLSLLGAVGVFSALGSTDTRFSIGGEYTVSQHIIAGLRVDHRTMAGQEPAVLAYGNGHLPFGPPAFRQALRLQVERRIQRRNHVTTVAVSHVF